MYFSVLTAFQASIRDEITSSATVDHIVRGHPMYINVALRYVRPKQAIYIRDSLQNLILEIIEDDQLDLETNPAEVCTYDILPGAFSLSNCRYTRLESRPRSFRQVLPVHGRRIFLTKKPSRIARLGFNTSNVSVLIQVLLLNLHITAITRSSNAPRSHQEVRQCDSIVHEENAVQYALSSVADLELSSREIS